MRPLAKTPPPSRSLPPTRTFATGAGPSSISASASAPNSSQRPWTGGPAEGGPRTGTRPAGRLHGLRVPDPHPERGERRHDRINRTARASQEAPNVDPAKWHYILQEPACQLNCRATTGHATKTYRPGASPAGHRPHARPRVDPSRSVIATRRLPRPAPGPGSNKAGVSSYPGPAPAIGPRTA